MEITRGPDGGRGLGLVGEGASIQSEGDGPFGSGSGGGGGGWGRGLVCVWGGCGMMGSPTQISHTALF